MAHYWDLGVGDGLDDRHPFAASLELDGLGSGPNQTGGVAYRVGPAGVVAHPRKVGDDHRAGTSARYGGGVVHEVVHRHVQRVVVAEHDHGHRVADQDQVDLRTVRDPGGGCVVGSHHDQRVI